MNDFFLNHPSVETEQSSSWLAVVKHPQYSSKQRIQESLNYKLKKSELD